MRDARTLHPFAASDHNHLPRHPASIVARQKSGGQGDVIRLRDRTEVWFSPAALLRDGVCCGHDPATTEHRKPCPSEQEHRYF